MNNFKYRPSLLGHYADRGCVLGLPCIQDRPRALVLRQGDLLEGQQAHHLRGNHCPDNHWYAHLHHHQEDGWKRIKVVKVIWQANLVKLFRLKVKFTILFESRWGQFIACFIFQPAFGCWVLKTLVEICLFKIFCTKTLKKQKSKKIKAKFRKKMFFVCLHSDAGKRIPFYSQKSLSNCLSICLFICLSICLFTGNIGFDQLLGAHSTQKLVEIHNINFYF